MPARSAPARRGPPRTAGPPHPPDAGVLRICGFPAQAAQRHREHRWVSIREIVESLGGFARKRELVARGARDRDLTNAVRSGEVARARNGWYSSVATSDARFRAIRVGGRLTGASALQLSGAWMRDTKTLHVSLPRNSARLRSQWNRTDKLTALRKHGAIVHWDPDEVVRGGTRTSVTLTDALFTFLLDAPFEEAIAVLDWALRTRAIDFADLDAIIRRLPARLRGIRGWVDPSCDSYPESLTRTRLRMHGHSVSSQIPVGRGELIDLVVEHHVGLEVDGREHHQDRFHKDRRKDLRIAIEGRHALRISVPMLEWDWSEILAAIAAALQARNALPRRRLTNRSQPAEWRTSTRQIGRSGRLKLPVFVTDNGLSWP